MVSVAMSRRVPAGRVGEEVVGATRGEDGRARGRHHPIRELRQASSAAAGARGTQGPTRCGITGKQHETEIDLNASGEKRATA
jgi:hypothetical protein